jgi:hypothetical protein
MSMASDKEFDYSWDDQDPDQMTELVSGEYAPSPDIEDYPYSDQPDCMCDESDNLMCVDCGHSLRCCESTACSSSGQSEF